jgi:hypothetical protein
MAITARIQITRSARRTALRAARQERCASATRSSTALGMARPRSTSTALEIAESSADVAETTVCAYMAVTVVLGVGLNCLVGWWWAEYVAAAILLFWLGRETMEVVEAARSGRAHACCDE